jgi:flagellar L-ring protein precursor FlgH
MRKFLPIAVVILGLLGLGCSIPKRHDPTLLVKPRIPYVAEAAEAGPTSEGSLWRDRSVVADLRARHMNDLVTLRITESTSALSKADVTTARDGSNSLSAPLLFSRFGGEAAGANSASAKTTATANKYKGNGTTGRSAVFNTTVTARVVKVLNNGNLIFEGFRDIKLNNETQRLYVAGILDPNRLDKNNSITSGLVAELRIGYGGEGVVDETLKPGFISRLLNFVWPF